MLRFRKLLRRLSRNVRSTAIRAEGRCADADSLATPFGQPVSPSSYRAALVTLSPARRELFELHQIEGLSFAEIGERKGILTEQVEREIGAALAQLAMSLATNFDSPPPPPSD